VCSRSIVYFEYLVADSGYIEESRLDIDPVLEYTGGGVSRLGFWWDERQCCVEVLQRASWSCCGGWKMEDGKFGC
jgi:hypothetical protein